MSERGHGAIEQKREEYLANLSLTDRNHLTNMSEKVLASMANKKLDGKLYVVGSSINNTPPAGDIDILVSIGYDLERTGDLTEFELAERSYDRMKDVVTDALKNKEKTQEEEKVRIEEFPPAIDEEFDSPNILKHEGTIKIHFLEGKPIDFINGMRNNAMDTRPKVLLGRSTS